MLLDSVVGEMDHWIFYVEEVELAGRCAYVALTVEIGAELAVERGEDHVMADIEFSQFIQ